MSEERRNALELASRQQWMLMELEHERRKERDRLQKDEALRSRELDEQVRRVEEVKREKVRSRSPYTSASRACAHVCRFASGALSSPFTLFFFSPAPFFFPPPPPCSFSFPIPM